MKTIFDRDVLPIFENERYYYFSESVSNFAKLHTA
jgi:hypothetical protein